MWKLVESSDGVARQWSSKGVEKSRKGRMAAMERLLSGGIFGEASPEDVAHENVAVKMIQREMSEADEANLLEEEDMHVFEWEPLADRLPLVSCNTCKKPIKASQYAAHAERCSSLTVADDSLTEIDGSNHKKPPRKARKKLLVGQDNVPSAAVKERLALDGDDAALPDTGGTSAGDSQEQVPARASFSNSRGMQKRVMNISEGTVVNAPRVGRARNVPLSVSPDRSTSGNDSSVAGKGSNSIVHGDGGLSPAKRLKPSKREDLDVICGVLKEQGGPCRQPLTCLLHSESAKRAVTGRRRPYGVLLQESQANMNRLRSSSKVHDSGSDPLPMTTKVYYLGHHHRMRAVLGSLFRETHGMDPSCNLTPNLFPSNQGVLMSMPTFSLDACGLDDAQQRGSISSI